MGQPRGSKNVGSTLKSAVFETEKAGIEHAATSNQLSISRSTISNIIRRRSSE